MMMRAWTATTQRVPSAGLGGTGEGVSVGKSFPLYFLAEGPAGSVLAGDVMANGGVFLLSA